MAEELHCSAHLHEGVRYPKRLLSNFSISTKRTINPVCTFSRTLELILDDIIAQDIKWQGQERPNRTEKQDPHESIVREYMLGDRLSGSRQLKEVRDMLRETLLSPKDDNADTEWMLKRLEILVKDWEANHSENSFMSAVSDQELAA